MIAGYAKVILEAGGCPECTIEILIDFANTFRNIGYKDHQDYIRACNED